MSVALRRAASSSRKGCWCTVNSPKTPHRGRQGDHSVKYKILSVRYKATVWLSTRYGGRLGPSALSPVPKQLITTTFPQLFTILATATPFFLLSFSSFFRFHS